MGKSELRMNGKRHDKMPLAGAVSVHSQFAIRHSSIAIHSLD